MARNKLVALPPAVGGLVGLQELNACENLLRVRERERERDRDRDRDRDKEREVRHLPLY